MVKKRLNSPCTIKIYAGANEYALKWKLADGTLISDTSGVMITRDIKINGYKGVEIPSEVLKGNLTCYGTSDLSVVYCDKDIKAYFFLSGLASVLLYEVFVITLKVYHRSIFVYLYDTICKSVYEFSIVRNTNDSTLVVM